MVGLLDGEYRPLTKRGLSQETCEKWGYRVASFRGKPCQVADYYSPDGKAVVAQKVRFPDKDFTVIGESKQAGLFGQHLWRDKGRMIVITEGEIDAMSVSQIQDNKWPVVSVPSGAQGAAKALAKQLEWLLGFETIVLMFDNDEPGRTAAQECADLFPPGRCKVASLPLKDANDMLRAERAKELIDAMWGAKIYRPDGLVTLSDIRGDILKTPVMGLPWWSSALTNLTYGRRLGECYAFGAGTGVGKTDFLMQQIAYDVETLDEKVGLFLLEQQPVESGKRLAGKVGKKCFHIPPDVGNWTQDQLEAALDKLDSDNKIHLYDHFGSQDWKVIQSRIRYLAKSEGVRIFYLDHLTALAAEENDERRALEGIMANIGSLVKELGIVLHFVSHLATPDGKPHEEGGRVMIRHFKGSRAIGFWSHYMFGLERNQQAEDPEAQKLTTFRVLKDRYTGRGTGKMFHLTYNSETGMLAEADGIGFDAVGESDGF